MRPGDIYMRPDLTGITAADFDKFREGAARGRAAALAKSEALRRLALPQEQYAAWPGSCTARLPPPPRIDAVQIAGLRKVNPALVRKHLDDLSWPAARHRAPQGRLARVFGEGDFESVDYALLGTRERRILE